MRCKCPCANCQGDSCSLLLLDVASLLLDACRCLILAPTRELAKQVAAEFESICPSLTVVSFYGGTSINAQVRLQ